MNLKLESLLLYAVTDRTWLGGQTLAQQVEAALRGGVTMVQLREKDLRGEELEQEAGEILALCRRYGVPLLINDDVELAARIGADGVHVGQDDMAAAEARALLGPDAIVGVTARTVDQALAAEAAGADYLGSGAVFGTSTKKDAKAMDPAYFQKICESVSIPVVAIGGITAGNIRRLEGRKMSGFAIVSGIFAAEDIEAKTRQLWKEAQALCLPGAVDRLRAAVLERRPVVQCITNIVTVNDCANALLAAGASPTMAHHPEEMEDFAQTTDALVCNMGATESLEAMLRAGEASLNAARTVRAAKAAEAAKAATASKTANAAVAAKAAEAASAAVEAFMDGADLTKIRQWLRPAVIDPVGCAASAFRREKCLDLISRIHPACIRGNAAEISALATGHNTGRGVDVLKAVLEEWIGDKPAGENSPAGPGPDPDLPEAVRDAVALSRKTGAIVVASGETDYITDGIRVYEAHGGTPWMTRVTGTGCMLSSLLGAFLAVENSALAAAACCGMMNACAEEAALRTAGEGGGTGTFRVRLIDAMSGTVTVHALSRA